MSDHFEKNSPFAPMQENRPWDQILTNPNQGSTKRKMSDTEDLWFPWTTSNEKRVKLGKKKVNQEMKKGMPEGEEDNSEVKEADGDVEMEDVVFIIENEGQDADREEEENGEDNEESDDEDLGDAEEESYGDYALEISRDVVANCCYEYEGPSFGGGDDDANYYYEYEGPSFGGEDDDTDWGTWGPADSWANTWK